MRAKFVQHCNSSPNLFLTKKTKYLSSIFFPRLQAPCFFPITILQMSKTVFAPQFKCLTIFAELITTGFEILNLTYATTISLKHVTDTDIHINIEIVESNKTMISKL